MLVAVANFNPCEITSHKRTFLKHMYRDGTLKNQPNKIGMHHNTFTPSLHLVPFFQLCLVFVSCVHRRIVEGSGVDSAGCVVHVNSELCCGWLQNNCYCAWQILCMADTVDSG